MTAAGPRDGQWWWRCADCATLLYRRRLRRNLDVCPGCGAHGRLGAPERIRQLVDPDSFVPLPGRVVQVDPLGFVDVVPYPHRLAAARAGSGLAEAVLCGTATLGGCPVVLAVMDFRFLGGSLGCVVGELVTRAAERALADRIPLVLVTASVGVRMQEGALALMQMAMVSQAVGALREAGVLTVSVLTDPTYGGVAASYATNTDVVVAEGGARMGFAGPRVIGRTTGQAVPAGFQTAGFLLRHGLVDVVAERRALRGRLVALVTAVRPVRPASVGGRAGHRGAAGGGGLRDGVPAGGGRYDGVPAGGGLRDGVPAGGGLRDGVPGGGGPGTPGGLRVGVAGGGDVWAVVRGARDPARPTTLDYLGAAFDDFLELHGDRLGGDCPAVVAGVARLGDRHVTVVGHQRGHTTAELVARNFGMASPAGHRKALRVMRLAARLGLPLVTLVDTPGADPGVDAERQGQAASIAEVILTLGDLPVPVVAVITGEGGGGGALALAVADRVLMLERAVYSAVSPEGCAAVLWPDRRAAPDAARALRLTAADLCRLGVADEIVPEPPGGAGRDPDGAARLLWRAVLANLSPLVDVSPAALVQRRRRRFRRFGAATAGTCGGLAGVR